MAQRRCLPLSARGERVRVRDFFLQNPKETGTFIPTLAASPIIPLPFLRDRRS